MSQTLFLSYSNYVHPIQHFWYLNTFDGEDLADSGFQKTLMILEHIWTKRSGISKFTSGSVRRHITHPLRCVSDQILFCTFYFFLLYILFGAFYYFLVYITSHNCYVTHGQDHICKRWQMTACAFHFTILHRPRCQIYKLETLSDKSFSSDLSFMKTLDVVSWSCNLVSYILIRLSWVYIHYPVQRTTNYF